MSLTLFIYLPELQLRRSLPSLSSLARALFSSTLSVCTLSLDLTTHLSFCSFVA